MTAITTNHVTASRSHVPLHVASPDGVMNRHLTSPRNELASPAASLDHHRFGGHNGVGGGVSGGVGGSGALTLAGYRSGAGGVGGRGLRDFLGIPVDFKTETLRE